MYFVGFGGDPGNLAWYVVHRKLPIAAALDGLALIPFDQSIY